MITYQLNITLLKFRLLCVPLEQLWSISHTVDIISSLTVAQVIEPSLTDIIQSENVFLNTIHLENFLFQGSAYIDFLMKYLVFLVKALNMTTGKFNKHINSDKIPLALEDKAQKIRDYWYTYVFSDDENPKSHVLTLPNWGSSIKKLRNKIAHRDQIKINEIYNINADGIEVEMPELMGMNYSRWVQDAQNGIYTMWEELAPVLFDLKWKSGPYQAGWWE